MSKQVNVNKVIGILYKIKLNLKQNKINKIKLTYDSLLCFDHLRTCILWGLDWVF